VFGLCFSGLASAFEVKAGDVSGVRRTKSPRGSKGGYKDLSELS
jgi:hypothetical protein